MSFFRCFRGISEPLQEQQAVHVGVATGPWGKLTIQIWPIQNKSVNGPTPMSLSTVFGVTCYGYFPMRFKNEIAISDVRQNRRGIGLPIRP